MTIKELLQACGKGEMPKVISRVPINGATSNIGVVTVIKADTAHAGHRGCGVKFPPLNYDIWFREEAAEDKRSKYMKDLDLVEKTV